MGKISKAGPDQSPEVFFLDYPDRLFVEARSPDEWYEEVFGLKDTDPSPYLVDLSECVSGWCSCLDFHFNVMPFLNDPVRTECKHITYARRYRDQFTTKPKPTPTQLVFT